MSKRPTGLGKGKGGRTHSPKTKKRLAVKHAMLAAKKKPKQKNKKKK
jgi:hypothetical protein